MAGVKGRRTVTDGEVAVAVLRSLDEALSGRERIVAARDAKRRPSLAKGEGIDARDRVWFAGWHAMLHNMSRRGTLERGLRGLPAATRATLEKVYKRLQTVDRNIAGGFNKLRAQEGNVGAFDKLTRETASKGTATPSPAVPTIAPRPQVNPGAPMSTKDAITLEAAAMVLSRRYNRPPQDVSKALRATVEDRVLKVGFSAAMLEAQEGLVWRLDRGLI